MKSQPSTPDPNPAVLPGALGPCGRPSWSGLLQFSLVSIPVKAFPAVSSSEATHVYQPYCLLCHTWYSLGTAEVRRRLLGIRADLLRFRCR